VSEEDSPGSVEQVIREILQYLIEHPDAKDTPEGISKWWRPSGRSDWRYEDIQSALDELASKGWLTMRSSSPPQKIYGFNKKYIKAVRAYLLKS
jgi:hypothetical protein